MATSKDYNFIYDREEDPSKTSNRHFLGYQDPLTTQDPVGWVRAVFGGVNLKEGLTSLGYTPPDDNLENWIKSQGSNFQTDFLNKAGLGTDQAKLNLIGGSLMPGSGVTASMRANNPAGAQAQYNKIDPSITSSQGKSPETLVNTITNPTTSTQTNSFTLTGGNLKEGTFNNENVKQLQGLLGITTDGDFGPKTKAAVMAFQKANGLVSDGIVGPATTAALNKKFGQTTQEATGTGGGTSTGATPASVVGTSTQARATTKEAELAKIKAELEQGANKPDQFDSVAKYDELRKDKGVVQDENELNAIQNEARMAKEELNQLKQTAGKELGMGGYTGNISEAERNLNFRLSSLALRESAVVDRLNTKNTYINTVISLGKDDYNTAKQAYDDEYNKNLKAMDIYNSELDDEQKDALTGFETISNLLLESGMQLTPQLSTQLDSYALKAGLPVGVFQQALSGLQEKEKIDNVKISGDNVYMWTTDSAGNPHLKLIQSLPSGNDTPKATNTYTVKSGDTFFDLASQLSSTVEALRAANPGVDENNLQIGQKINLPSGGALQSKIVTTADGNQINIASVSGIKQLVDLGYTAGEIKAYLTSKDVGMSVTTADQLLKDAGLLGGSSGSSDRSLD